MRLSAKVKRMNKNRPHSQRCSFCGNIFQTNSNRNVYCSLRCRLSAESSVQNSWTECHLWEGHKDRDGYGRLRWQYREIGAHVAAWECANGPLPKGAFVMHTCDNPSCINPEHLRLGTAALNALDRDAKRRGGHNPKAGDNGRRAKRDKTGRFVSI